MSLNDKFLELAQRVKNQKDNIKTEEATKHSLVLPFLNSLGYDVFDNQVIVPEFTADIGTKKGEKVDYAILKDGKPLVLIEVKNHNENLDNHHNQLVRYFHAVAEVKFAILTNGIEYRFFSDIENNNIMDKTPFMVFDLEHIRQKDLKELEKFTKEQLDVESIVKFASITKNHKQIQEIFRTQIESPDDEFVKFFAIRMTNKRMTENIINEYRIHIKKALQDIINDLASEKIIAVKNSLSKDEKEDSHTEDHEDENLIVTTEEELQGLYIVKSFFVEFKDFNIERISYRDTISYFGIIADNNLRKWFCRLWFNGTKKYITIPTHEKDQRIDLENVYDLYKFKNEIIQSFELKTDSKLINGN
ncbi:hypothetical protein CQA53_00315 [Helicobacter didelphidarum]|uniref:Restriction endonuclease type I HsdR N-terminal domain-containing protein n=1 Tax=Helicobacter didelphidarum TaxID=2040648 RepID=A0A3D8IQF0_9HELI|nr:type I restriction endonuclease [Helicobacter didelphidarum]RDU67508.1 hypothetical protein CQA53_00315 [Helicobacter didelphidarum]